MLDPTALGVLTAALEKIVDTALEYDPGTRAALAALAGKTIAFESTFPPATIYFSPQAASVTPAVSLQAFSNTPPDTHLRGSLPAMIMLLVGEQRSLADSGVSVTGDSALLARLQDIFANVELDWEEPLTGLLGPGVGHPLAQLLRRQGRWAGESAEKARRFAGEYLVEELRVTPGQEELRAFYQDVDELSSATDRLAARVTQLAQQIQK